MSIYLVLFFVQLAVAHDGEPSVPVARPVIKAEHASEVPVTAVIESVKTSSQYEKAAKSNLPLIADISADWCQPCQLALPIVLDWAQRYEGRVKFVEVELEVAEEKAILNEDEGIPTFVFFKPGMVEWHRMHGFIDNSRWRRLFGDFLKDINDEVIEISELRFIPGEDEYDDDDEEGGEGNKDKNVELSWDDYSDIVEKSKIPVVAAVLGAPSPERESANVQFNDLAKRYKGKVKFVVIDTAIAQKYNVLVTLNSSVKKRVLYDPQNDITPIFITLKPGAGEAQEVTRVLGKDKSDWPQQLDKNISTELLPPPPASALLPNEKALKECVEKIKNTLHNLEAPASSGNIF